MTTTHERRWLRFNLRTALLASTAFAIAVWVYWDGWQRWQWYVDQRTFVESARVLKAGGLTSEEWLPPFRNKYPHTPQLSPNTWHDKYGHFHRSLMCSWPNALFVVYWRYEGSCCSSVEVFKLPVALSDYQPHSERERENVRQGIPPLPTDLATGTDREAFIKANNPAKAAYRREFLKMIQGDRRDSMGFEYELIHSDFL